MTAAVLFENVSRHFGAVRAVDAVDLAVAEGEFFAMLGPSGSGKTTCLRLMAGFEQPTGGHIEIFGETAEGVPPYRRNVNTVFQDYALFPHLSILDNVAYGLMVKGVAREERRKAAEDALAMVKLPGYGTRRPGQLSGGQRQRVALARAMAIEPRVLLLDEPFGALDAKVRKELRRWLREIHDKTMHTTVFVTHDQDEALELADRVVVMSQGKIEQIGTPDQVYDTPNSPFVYGFIGESSSLTVRIDNGEVWLADRTLGLKSDAPDGNATLYFRPHDVELIDGCGGCIAGTVIASRRVGATRRVELEIGGAAERVEIEIPADHPAREKSRIAFRPKHWRVFPQA